MGYRSRSRSRSRSPSGSPRDRKRSTTPMRREPPTRTSLLIRNIARGITAEDLRYHAEKYGQVRDIYLPKDYYSGEARGIGFVEFTSARDAEDAKYGLDRYLLGGRELAVCFAMQGRKRPDDYRREGGGGGGGGYGGGGPRGGPRQYGSYNNSGYNNNYRRRSYSRSPPRRGYSPPPRRGRSPERSPRREYSRSPRRQYRRSPSPGRGRSPPQAMKGGVGRSPPRQAVSPAGSLDE